MKDLLVTTDTPALRSGQQQRTYGVARALAAKRRPHAPLRSLRRREPDHAFRSIPGIELVEVLPSRGLRRLLAYARARLSGVPGGLCPRRLPRARRRQAARLAEAARPRPRDRRRPDRRRRARGARPAAPVIYNAHNLESGFRHELSLGPRDPRRLRSFERRLLERARASPGWSATATSTPRASSARGAPALRAERRRRDGDSRPSLRRRSSGDDRRAIYVASFTYEPNRNGLRFLLDEVFPRVWAELPDARLSLVGEGLEQPPSADPRVETLGFVDDLADAYGRARCAVVPLLQGGGTPLKFIEALAYGLPVIATPRAAQGLDVHDGEDCLIAADAELLRRRPRSRPARRRPRDRPSRPRARCRALLDRDARAPARGRVAAARPIEPARPPPYSRAGRRTAVDIRPAESGRFTLPRPGSERSRAEIKQRKDATAPESTSESIRRQFPIKAPPPRGGFAQPGVSRRPPSHRRSHHDDVFSLGAQRPGLHHRPHRSPLALVRRVRLERRRGERPARAPRRSPRPAASFPTPSHSP